MQLNIFTKRYTIKVTNCQRRILLVTLINPMCLRQELWGQEDVEVFELSGVSFYLFFRPRLKIIVGGTRCNASHALTGHAPATWEIDS